MGATSQRRARLCAIAWIAGALVCASGALADEIRLKDGKKLYGVIVAYEDNMFKVKTDFGYVLVEKDKIAQIIPNTTSAPDAAKPAAQPAAKPPAESVPKAEPAVATSTGTATTPTMTTASERSVTPAPAKRGPIVTNPNARPEIPAANVSEVSAPALKASAATPKTALGGSVPPPAPPKEEIREEIQGNLYINHEYAFRMYKAPGWQIIEGAGQSLPNAIVAMGTQNESTLLVVGRETSKAGLDAASQSVEKRLHDVYENYRLASQRKTVVGGQPAVEFKYRGMADGHDWSGTLLVVAHGGDVFTVLGMTYADTDLIQIQENVIARAVSSFDFNVK